MEHLLRNWTVFVTSQPRMVLSVIAVSTVLALIFAVANFSIDSDTTKLIRQDTDWKRTFDDYEAAFPQLKQNTMIVVSHVSFQVGQVTLLPSRRTS